MRIIVGRARTTTLAIVAAFAVFAIVVGFVIREPLERMLFVRSADAITGLDVSVERVEHDGDGYLLDGLRARMQSGAALLDAPRARVVRRDREIAIELERPHITFDPNRYRDADRLRSRDAIASWHGGEGFASVRVRDGTLAVVANANAVTSTPLAFDGIDGSVRADRANLTYDVALQFLDGGTRYPIVGRSQTPPEGEIVQTWSAPLLPIGPLDAFVSRESPLHPLDGFARDVAIADGAALRAGAQLDRGRIAIGAHTIAGLHGALVVADGGIGSRHLSGTLDAVPFDAAGEVHDLHAHYRWSRDGSSDLASLARLTTEIANEPKLRWVHIEATAPGLAYGQYGLSGDHGPLAVSVLAIDPREPTLRFDTAIAQNHIISGGERTSAMGVRTRAVAGVNGDYFDIGRTYQPQGMLVHAGALMRGPADRAALAIDKNKHVTFSEFHLHGEVTTRRGRMPITEFNDWPPGDVSIITSDYGKALPEKPGVTFVRLQARDPRGKRYRVVAVEPATQPIAAGFGIAIGPLVKGPRPRVGDDVDVSYRVNPSLGNALAAIGGGPILLRDGAWYEDPHAPAPDEHDYRWPVVALARQRDDRLLLVAVDGRHPERSVGMMRPEFGDLLLRFDCVDAMALDSGGSVTLVSRAPGDADVSVRNVPSDNSAERWISDALFIYSSAPQPTIVPIAHASTSPPEARPAP